MSVTEMETRENIFVTIERAPLFLTSNEAACRAWIKI